MNAPVSSMMPALTMAGNADSGFGVRMSGFYFAVAEWAQKASELTTHLPQASGMAHWEANGYAGMIVWENEFDREIWNQKKLLTFRREPYQLFLGLDQFLRHHKVRHVVSASLSGSLGSLSLAMLVQTA